MCIIKLCGCGNYHPLQPNIFIQILNYSKKKHHLRSLKKKGLGGGGLNFPFCFWEVFYEKVEYRTCCVGLEKCNHAVRRGAGRGSLCASPFIIGVCKCVCECLHYRSIFRTAHHIKSSLQYAVPNAAIQTSLWMTVMKCNLYMHSEEENQACSLPHLSIGLHLQILLQYTEKAWVQLWRAAGSNAHGLSSPKVFLASSSFQL